MRFSRRFRAVRIEFDRASTSERVYSVDVINSRTTYQFDKHFLVRLIAQYDSSAERVLTDLLASYEFVPGTVFHAGFFRRKGLFTFVRWNYFFTNPPLCITEAELSEAFAIIDRGLAITDQAVQQ